MNVFYKILGENIVFKVNVKIRLFVLLQIAAMLCEPILAPVQMVYATEQNEEVETYTDETDTGEVEEDIENDVPNELSLECATSEDRSFTSMGSEEVDSESIFKEISIDEVAVENALTNDELFENYVDKQFYGMYDIALLAAFQSAGDRLSGLMKVAYNQLKPQIQIVAREGGATNNFEVTIADSTVWEQVKAIGESDLHALVSALLSDMPYELYWFDKTKNGGISLSAKKYSTKIIMTFKCVVAQAYRQDDNPYAVTSDVSKVSVAATEAKRVADLYASWPQELKLDSFCDYICNAVSYNNAAANDTNTPYGDPWQLIYVFDNDSNTNVVCEGYAKAFKYLCDMTGEACYLATGYMGPLSSSGQYGPHMWNIVTLDNGANLLVDITNCDEGTSGFPKKLFLVMGEYVTSGPISVNDIPLDGYERVGGTRLNYYYDLGLRDVLGSDVLTLRQAGSTPSGGGTSIPMGDAAYGNLTENPDGSYILTVTGSGEISSLSALDKYRDKIKEIKIENGITVIGNNAFSGMNNLLYANIPDTVTKLGHNCFANCPKLMRIFIPYSVQDILEDANARPLDAPFYGNKKMTIYCEISSLKDRPLQYMSSPRTEWSSYWNRYGEYATNVIDVVWNYTLGDYAYWETIRQDYDSTSVTIDVASLTNKQIIAGAFYNHTSLRNIDITGTTGIGKFAFAECTNLESIQIPDSVTEIGLAAFEHTGLKHAIIPSSVATIKQRTFSGCNNLETVYIPSSVETLEGKEIVGTDAQGNPNDMPPFYGCGKLSIYTAISRTKMAEMTSGNSTGWYSIKYSLTHTPDDVNWEYSLEEYKYWVSAIENAGNKETIDLTEADVAITRIPIAAFRNKTALKTIILPDTLLGIGASAFEGCQNLDIMYIPKNVTTIGKNAFLNAMGSLYCEAVSFRNDSGTYKAGIDPSWLGNDADNAMKVSFDINREDYAYWTTLDKAAREVVIPESVRTIPLGAFDGFDTLRLVYIPATVERINDTSINASGYITYNRPGYVTLLPFYNKQQTIIYCGISEETARNKWGEQFNVYDSGNLKCETFYNIAPESTYFKQVYFVDGDSQQSREYIKYYKYGELPIPAAKEYYDFQGWYTGSMAGNEIKPESAVSGVNRLYARWRGKEYTMSLIPMGGECNESEVAVHYMESYGQLPGAARTGYIFQGWSTVKEADSGVLSNRILADHIFEGTSDTEVYAIWKAKEYKIIYKLNNGTMTGMTDKTVTYEQTYGELPEPTYDGHRFTGWYTDENLTETSLITADSIVDIADNHTLYAGWRETRQDEDTFGELQEEDVEELGVSATPADVPENLWISRLPESVDYTGSAITFSDMRVFYHKKLLKVGTDYTVKYANNTKAGTAKITIAGKGNYSGTIVKTFEIMPLSLEATYIDKKGETHCRTNVQDITLAYNKKVQKGTSIVVYNIAADEENERWITLKKGTDYIFEYPEVNNIGSYQNPTVGVNDIGYTVRIVGKGNYSGENYFTEHILDTTQSDKKLITGSKIKISISKNEDLSATGSEKKPKLDIYDENEILQEGEDYKVSYQNNILPGTANIIVEGIGDYCGTKTLTFKITAIPLSKAVIKWGESFDTGSTTIPSGIYKNPSTEYKPTSYHLRNAGNDLIEGKDFIVGYGGDLINAGKGKAYITFTGINKYSGTIKKSYTIGQCTVSSWCARLETGNLYLYEKNGSKPKVNVKVNGYTLEEGKDYTVTYSNNTKVTYNPDAPETISVSKKPKVTVKYKGNYVVDKNYPTILEYDIVPSEIDEKWIDVSDVVEQSKGMKASVIVKDDKGGVLKSGVDYYINYDYSDPSSPTGRMGVSINPKSDEIRAGAKIVAVITANGNYKNKQDVVSKPFRILPAGYDISKAIVTIPVQTYTGYEIKLKESDIDVKMAKNGSSLRPGVDYKIDQNSYTKNADKGTATVIINGIGEYGGTKTVSFTIAAKSMLYTIQYDNNDIYMSGLAMNTVKATGTMKNSNITAGSKLAANTYKRAGYTFIGWNTKPDGSGESFANSAIFTASQSDYKVLTPGSTIKLFAQWRYTGEIL